MFVFSNFAELDISKSLFKLVFVSNSLFVIGEELTKGVELTRLLEVVVINEEVRLLLDNVVGALKLGLLR